ncbi:hypothetical protein B0J12DRAFT_84259 [Macrophomina phaseolina]|uniref:Uncharacterized protein n=1 Tax=Macrophomina phaseolina TaxID=35725 RepID=A0ABQ8GCA7_9PEZI|nr:hypothetical protein B0J12DRAFT_84259 [Macrophomina phaseolina]
MSVESLPFPHPLPHSFRKASQPKGLPPAPRLHTPGDSSALASPRPPLRDPARTGDRAQRIRKPSRRKQQQAARAAGAAVSTTGGRTNRSCHPSPKCSRHRTTPICSMTLNPSPYTIRALPLLVPGPPSTRLGSKSPARHCQCALIRPPARCATSIAAAPSDGALLNLAAKPCPPRDRPLVMPRPYKLRENTIDRGHKPARAPQTSEKSVPGPRIHWT